MYHVNQQQIHDFLENILELSADDIHNRHDNRLHFLTSLCSAYDCHIPIQNLTTTCVPFPERKLPTLQDNIEAVFAQLGGRCWTLNTVMYVLLKELGYDTRPIIGSAYEDGRYNHIMILVENVDQKGDVYLVDPGFGGTAHCPVPLNFDVASPIYKAGHQTTQWIKRDNMYIRQDLLDPVINGKIQTTEGPWGNICYFTLEEHSLEWIGRSLDKWCYAKPEFAFNVTRRITGTNKDLKKFVAILNDKLLIEDENGKLRKSVLETDKDIIAAVKKYFPMFPSDIVRQAYKIWHQFDKHITPMK